MFHVVTPLNPIGGRRFYGVDRGKGKSMWFDGVRQPNTLYVASSSRGKDSTAMLRAIQLMDWPLDAIVSVDIWFDDDTPAELPPMVEFKNEYDKKVLEWFGVPVTRLCAMKRNKESETEEENHTKNLHTAECSTTSCKAESLSDQSKDSPRQSVLGASTSKQATEQYSSQKQTYKELFYQNRTWGTEKLKFADERTAQYIGFPSMTMPWCNGGLKRGVMNNKNILEKLTYSEIFYREIKNGNGWDGRRTTYGFPTRQAPWCNSELKVKALNNP